MRCIFSALAAAALLAIPASAQAPKRFDFNANFRADSPIPRLLAVEGSAFYPEGTRLRVGIRARGSAVWILKGEAVLKHHKFLSEFNLGEASLPAGWYEAVVEFEFNDQSKHIQEAMKLHADFDKCLLDKEHGDQLLKELGEKDPEYLKRLQEFIKREDRCPTQEQSGRKFFQVGGDADAEALLAEEAAFLRDHVDTAFETLSSLCTLQAGDPAATQTALSDASTAVEQTDAAVRERRRGLAWCPRSSVYDALANALFQTARLREVIESLSTGEGARTAADLAELDALTAPLNKDERRRHDALATALERIRATRAATARAALSVLADALHGASGLDPSPDLRLDTLQRALESCGLEPE